MRDTEQAYRKLLGARKEIRDINDRLRRLRYTSLHLSEAEAAITQALTQLDYADLAYEEDR